MVNIKNQAWAVVMFDGSLPDFSVEGKMQNVLQIHSRKKSAEDMAKSINKHNPSPKEKLWFAVPCTITYKI